MLWNVHLQVYVMKRPRVYVMKRPLTSLCYETSTYESMLWNVHLRNLKTWPACQWRQFPRRACVKKSRCNIEDILIHFFQRNCQPEAGDWQPEAADWQLEAADWQPETADWQHVYQDSSSLVAPDGRICVDLNFFKSEITVIFLIFSLLKKIITKLCA